MTSTQSESTQLPVMQVNVKESVTTSLFALLKDIMIFMKI